MDTEIWLLSMISSVCKTDCDASGSRFATSWKPNEHYGNSTRVEESAGLGAVQLGWSQRGRLLIGNIVDSIDEGRRSPTISRRVGSDLCGTKFGEFIISTQLLVRGNQDLAVFSKTSAIERCIRRSIVVTLQRSKVFFEAASLEEELGGRPRLLRFSFGACHIGHFAAKSGGITSVWQGIRHV